VKTPAIGIPVSVRTPSAFGTATDFGEACEFGFLERVALIGSAHEISEVLTRCGVELSRLALNGLFRGPSGGTVQPSTR
jgi:hypothetical protein